MNRQELTRASFKHNFLKNVIFRMDFLGVLQPEMEKVLLKIKPFLKESGFKRYDERTDNLVSININENGVQAQQNINQVKVFSFTNDDNGCSVDLSSTFVCLKLNTDRYMRFEDYAEVFKKIIATYQSTLDFFVMKRLGLRKINFCFIKNPEEIDNYFNSKYFSSNTALGEGALLKSRKEEHLSAGEMKVNLNYLIEQGVVKGDKLFKITIDTDVYLDNTDDIITAFESNGFSKLNDTIFEIYVDALTDHMIDRLTNVEDFSEGELLGVERNEQ